MHAHTLGFHSANDVVKTSSENRLSLSLYNNFRAHKYTQRYCDPDLLGVFFLVRAFKINDY